jgi:hypothetical protein
MKLYLISQTACGGYDTYDSAVVCAEDEAEAQITDPSGYSKWHDGGWYFQYTNSAEKLEKSRYDWTSNPLKDVKVLELGEANEGMEKGVICASFNAG